MKEQISKLQLILLIVIIWIQTANYQFGTHYANFASQLVIRFLLSVFVISILIFNVTIVESLKSNHKSIEEKKFYLIKLLYPVIVASSVICLTRSREQIFIWGLLFTLLISIDWFDKFKNFENKISRKLNEYRISRGMQIVEDRNSIFGLFLLLVIDGAIIYIAARKILY